MKTFLGAFSVLAAAVTVGLLLNIDPRRRAEIMLETEEFVQRWWIQDPNKVSDRTAAGVAKIRHFETIFPVEGEERRLFQDPYAEYFYAGSTLVNWLPKRALMRLVGDQSVGLMLLLAGRTAFFDEQVKAAVAAGVKQVVILGAGYDTRGIRLGLPKDVTVFEMDQKDLQEKKKSTLEGIANSGALPVDTSRVRYVPVDFAAGQGVKTVPDYDPAAATVFTLEGVAQYIPKEATGRTVLAAAALCGDGSRFIMSYVPQELYEDPHKVGAQPDETKTLLRSVAKAGEPWVSGWYQHDFAAFMRQRGFEVQRDISVAEIVEEYYTPARRHVPARQRIGFERYVIAHKV